MTIYSSLINLIKEKLLTLRVRPTNDKDVSKEDTWAIDKRKKNRYKDNNIKIIRNPGIKYLYEFNFDFAKHTLMIFKFHCLFGVP